MSFWHDLRHGARLVRKAPLFTLGSVIVLALGIGLTMAMFSLVDAALLRSLPFSDATQFVMLWEHVPQNARNRVAGLDFVDCREQSQSFAGMPRPWASPRQPCFGRRKPMCLGGRHHQ